MNIPSVQFAAVCQFLGRIWLKEIDAAMLEKLNQPAVRQAMEELDAFVPPNDPETLEQLAVDYCQLLIGPQEGISPIQSVWEQGQLQGNAAASMMTYLKQVPDYQPQTNLVDHLGVQLELFGIMIGAAHQQEQTEEFEPLIHQFADQHLSWSTEMLERVEARASTEFYQGLARMTRNLMALI